MEGKKRRVGEDFMKVVACEEGLKGLVRFRKAEEGKRIGFGAVGIAGAVGRGDPSGRHCVGLMKFGVQVDMGSKGERGLQPVP